MGQVRGYVEEWSRVVISKGGFLPYYNYPVRRYIASIWKSPEALK